MSQNAMGSGVILSPGGSQRVAPKALTIATNRIHKHTDDEFIKRQEFVDRQLNSARKLNHANAPEAIDTLNSAREHPGRLASARNRIQPNVQSPTTTSVEIKDLIDRLSSTPQASAVVPSKTGAHDDSNDSDDSDGS